MSAKNDGPIESVYDVIVVGGGGAGLIADFKGADLRDAVIDDAALGSPELRHAIRTEYTTQSEGQTQDILRQHALWLDTQGRDGARATLTQIDLCGRRFDDARLVLAILKGARLQRASLIRAQLVMGDLAGADLRGAALREADLRGGVFHHAHFNAADLAGARLGPLRDVGDRHRELPSNFERARFAGANLAGADLQGANLVGADFTGANLAGARLQDARLDDATFTGAVLAGAGFDGASRERAVDLP